MDEEMAKRRGKLYSLARKLHRKAPSMVNNPAGPADFEQVLKRVCISHQRGKHGSWFITVTEKALLIAFWKHSLQKSIGWAAVSPVLLIGEK